jgi:hypothetical protein
MVWWLWQVSHEVHEHARGANGHEAGRLQAAGPPRGGKALGSFAVQMANNIGQERDHGFPHRRPTVRRVGVPCTAGTQRNKHVN